ncbi:MAG TPA: spore germination protein GerW family protein [Candidatus Binatia bacterium]|nr:spore germination protein GerW family protein [Candidatus Binatia bacterium]
MTKQLTRNLYPSAGLSSSNNVRSWIEGESTMSSLALLQSLKESIVAANVKAVYGEPIAAQGKTVIPVAKIVYGYGAGAGTGGVGDSGARGEGGGGGGGAVALPVGVVEISDQQTRFVPIHDRKKLAGAVAVGIGIGMLLNWRRRR